MAIEAYDPKGFGAAVRAARKERGWSQSELASWLGVSRPTVAALEAGGPVAMPTAMRALALLGRKAVIAPKGSQVNSGTGDGDA
jgi:transcriptional regulator with XRE-family HTH domain